MISSKFNQIWISDVFYDFPEADHIDEYLAAIAGREEFFVARRPDSGIIILNYHYALADSFPDPARFADPVESRSAALRRDCRGIKFDIVTGKVVTKPYNKFFNCGEKEETMPRRVDWSQPHWILEKLDGSFITDHFRPDGVREWHTKMGATDVAIPVGMHVEKMRGIIDYERFNDEMRARGYTAIYEWCSNQQRIVISYPEDKLILTGLRHIKTGRYLLYPKMKHEAEAFGIPVVRALPGSVENIDVFLAEADALIGEEGYVIRFATGHMLKVKAEDYRRQHKIKDGLNQEKDVLAMIFAGTIDDAKVHMSEDDMRAVERFSDDVMRHASKLAHDVVAHIDRARVVCPDKRTFAVNYMTDMAVPSWLKPLLFAVWDGKDATDVVNTYIAKHTSTQTKVDEIRDLLGGLKWADYRNVVILED